MFQPPPINQKTLQDLTEKMKGMVPYYTPEWKFRPDDPSADPGTGLFYLFANMLLGSMDRLNKVPTRNYLYFLNLINATAHNVKPATSHVTFQLSRGRDESVRVPAGTQVAAFDDQENEIKFETTEDLLATPALLQAVVCTSTSQDRVWKIKNSAVSAWRDIERNSPPAVPLFQFPEQWKNRQHVLYLGERDLFDLTHGSTLELSLFSMTNTPAENNYGTLLKDVTWQYFSDTRWRNFDIVSTDNLQSNTIKLIKTAEAPIVPLTIKGMESRWIRCVLPPQSVNNFSDIAIGCIKARANSGAHFVPDLLFADDHKVSEDKCYPYGQFFSDSGIFYIGQREVFSKKGSMVTMTFTLTLDRKQRADVAQASPGTPPLTVSIEKVAWEYWNGENWAPLAMSYPKMIIKFKNNTQSQEILAKSQFTVPAKVATQAIDFDNVDNCSTTSTFVCPEDMQMAMVFNNRDYWIRARIVAVSNLYTNNPIYNTPVVQDLKFQYTDTPARDLVQCLSNNYTELSDYQELLKHQTYQGGQYNITKPHAFNPFHGLDGTHPALYLGLDRPLLGNVCLFITLLQQERSAKPHAVTWQYQKADGKWDSLNWVTDGTQGLTRSGPLRFAAPAQWEGQTLFGQRLYWIRAVDGEGQWDQPFPEQPLPIVQGIALHAVSVTQQEHVTQEMPRQVKVNGSVHYQLFNRPVFHEQVWVNEAGEMTEQEIKALEQVRGAEVRFDRDVQGNVLRVWRLWSPVAVLDDSGTDDRHYVIDHIEGTIRFGDGKHGKMPPTEIDKIAVDYKLTRGASGNVEAGSINRLRQSVAFVQAVRNPIPASGGCDAEPIEQVMKRSPHLVKHRHRAITAEDYELLAREANPIVAKVKYMPPDENNGTVTLCIYPRGGVKDLRQFADVQAQVEQYLYDHSNMQADSQRIHVRAVAELQISVTATLRASKGQEVPQVGERALARLYEFLDPLKGGKDGRGWEIGQPLYRSLLYPLLQSVAGVAHIEELHVKVQGGQFEELTDLPIIRADDGLVMNGTHQIQVLTSDNA